MKPTSMRWPADLREALERAATDEGRTPSNLVRYLTQQWLRERGYLPPLAGAAR